MVYYIDMPRATKKTKRRQHTKGYKHLRKQKTTKKVIKNGDVTKIPGVYIQTFGSSQINTKINDKKSQSKVEWVGDYDGEMAKLQVDINKNKKHQLIKLNMNNEQLSHLLGRPPVEQDLRQRLEQDLLNSPQPKLNVDKIVEVPKPETKVIIQTMKTNDIPLFGNNPKTVKFINKSLKNRNQTRN